MGDPRVRSQDPPAQILALQSGAGNAAVARAVAGGQLGVAREVDFYTVGNEGGAHEAEASEGSSEESLSEDPQARLVRAISERVAEKGKIGEKPPAPPPDPYAVSDGGLRGAEESPLRGGGEVLYAGSGGGQAAEASRYDTYKVADEAVSEDLPASASVATPPSVAADEGSLYDVYKVSEDEASEVSADEASEVSADEASEVSADEASEVSADEESSSSAGGVPYTLPPDAEAEPTPAAVSAPPRPSTPAPALPPPVAYTPPPTQQKMGKAKRALKALAKPFQAIGGAIKKAVKGRKGKKGAAPTAAELLADPADVVAPPSSSSAAPVKYTVYQNKSQVKYTPYKPSAPPAQVPHPLAADIEFSEDAPAPAPDKYGNLAKMGMSPDERHSSEKFLNNTLLAGNFLAVDMVRFGLAQRSEGYAAIQADPVRAREGLKKVWGWSDEDIAKYYDASTGRAKSTKVDYITSEQDLKKFVVRAGATLQYGDPPQPFDTSGMLSKASGPGFAIFVMDAQGNIYAGQHRVGLFHHSSFLAGRAVAAAGEMKVSGGTLVELTSKSGHYSPDTDQMHQMLQELAGAGVSLAGVRIKLWVPGPGGKGTVTNYYDAAEFLAKKLQAKPTGGGHMFQ